MLAMTTYQPSPELSAELAAFDAAKTAFETAKERLREAIAAELKSQDVTSKTLAPKTPWSDETVRGIAREYDVPLRRQPTVKSIKPRKKPGGSTSG